MADKDVALGILQASVAIGGLLLIFVGYLLFNASQISSKAQRVRTKSVAVGGLVPFLMSLACAWQSILAVQGVQASAQSLFISIKIVLVLTALYAILATIFEVQ